jgi:hypothetical protein
MYYNKCIIIINVLLNYNYYIYIYFLIFYEDYRGRPNS